MASIQTNTFAPVRMGSALKDALFALAGVFCMAYPVISAFKGDGVWVPISVSAVVVYALGILLVRASANGASSIAAAMAFFGKAYAMLALALGILYILPWCLAMAGVFMGGSLAAYGAVIVLSLPVFLVMPYFMLRDV